MSYLKKGLSFFLYFHKNQLQGGPSWWIYAWFGLLIFFLSIHAPTTCDTLWFAVRHTEVDQKYFYFYAILCCQTQQTGNDLIIYELTIQPVCEVVRKNPHFLLLQLTYGSSNWLSLVAIDFTQSTWFTTSKVNCKNISEFLSKNFPIHFQSPIDFTQLHMIRPLISNSREFMFSI